MGKGKLLQKHKSIHQHGKGPDRCNKAGFTSSITAESALERIRNTEDVPGKTKPTRAYHCPFCDKWHLTHREKFAEIYQKPLDLKYKDEWAKLLAS